VNDDCLKLTTYCAERDRAGERFVADALVDLYARHELATSVVLRGIEGFGKRDRLQTERLLTLSENLPIVTVAVDRRDRIEAVLADASSLVSHGLLTLERARMLTGGVGEVRLPQQLDDETKLTVYCGRQERIGGRPAHVAVVDALHRQGIAGATVLLGVDGTAHGIRRRAKFLGRNAEVPMMIISVGDAGRIASALPELSSMLARPLMTLERIQVLKRDGRTLGALRPVPETDEAGLSIWRKMMVYTGEQVRVNGHPLYVQLVRQLRNAGADGATALRGIWGYHGDHRPHGDKLLSLRRHVPVVTIAVDTPERMRSLYAVVDELTAETGLVTSEIVPASRALTPDGVRGGLGLARRLPG
jgi:PII-like signaling protein